MQRSIYFSLLVFVCLIAASLAQASGIKVKVISVNQNSNNIIIHYRLMADTEVIGRNTPAYVFLTYGTDSTNPLLAWNRAQQVSGDIGMVSSTGSKTIIWNWYSEPGLAYNLILSHAQVRVTAIEMVRVTDDAYLTMGNSGSINEVNGVTYVPPFYLMKYPVTVKQYVDFLNAQANSHDPSSDNYYDYWSDQMTDPNFGHIQKTGQVGAGATWDVAPGYDDYAMVYVCWYNAYAYAKWAGLDLCTEEEFEKASRGTDSRLYNWGNMPPNKTLANYENNVGYPSDVNAYEYDLNKQGGSPYGAYDLAGNVREWQDTLWYSSGSYDSSKSKTSYYSGNDALRVLRGGCWRDNAPYLRASARLSALVTTRNNLIGFRCVKR